MAILVLFPFIMVAVLMLWRLNRYGVSSDTEHREHERDGRDQ